MIYRFKIKLEVCLLAYLFLCLPVVLPAQTEPVVSAYRDILAGKTTVGLSRLSLLQTKGDDFYISLYAQDLAQLFEVLAEEQKDLRTAFEEAGELRAAEALAYTHESPYKAWLVAELELHQAFADIKFGEQLRPAWKIRSAYRQLTALNAKNPDFLPVYKSLGLLHVLVGSIPEKYDWVLTILGMSGDIAEGREELQRVAHSRHFLKEEARILQAVVSAYLLDQPEIGLSILANASTPANQHMLLSYVLAALHLKASQAEEALKVIQRAPKSPEFLQVPVLQYFMGEIYLQRGDYELAIYYYKAFLERFQGENLVKDAHHKIGMAHWLQGHLEEALEWKKKAKRAGTTVVEADKAADRMLDQREYPNIALLKLRLFIDGGYFDKASNLMDVIDVEAFSEDVDQLEYVYRKARLAHKQKQLSRALTFYQQVITPPRKPQPYFVPNACLQMAEILIGQGKPAQAIEYLEKVFDYRQYPYESSLENKAKYLLNAIDH